MNHYMPLFSQVKEPARPFTPGINSIDEFESFKFKVKIAVQGRDDFIAGEMILNSDVLNTPDNKIIKIKEISKITVQMWERRTTINNNVFYPSRYELLFNDNRKIIINGNIDSLNKIKTGNKKSGYIYFYYYDYFKNGKWINSGVSDYAASISKTTNGCGVSIELIQ